MDNALTTGLYGGSNNLLVLNFHGLELRLIHWCSTFSMGYTVTLNPKTPIQG